MCSNDCRMLTRLPADWRAGRVAAEIRLTYPSVAFMTRCPLVSPRCRVAYLVDGVRLGRRVRRRWRMRLATLRGSARENAAVPGSPGTLGSRVALEAGGQDPLRDAASKGRRPTSIACPRSPPAVRCPSAMRKHALGCAQLEDCLGPRQADPPGALPAPRGDPCGTQPSPAGSRSGQRVRAGAGVDRGGRRTRHAARRPSHRRPQVSSVHRGMPWAVSGSGRGCRPAHVSCGGVPSWSSRCVRAAALATYWRARSRPSGRWPPET